MNDTKRWSARLHALDLARGLAVVAMAVYHLTWDLWAFGLTAADLLGDPAWLAFRTAIAASFLFLAGFREGMARHVDRPAAVRRFIKLAAAAAAISLVTWWMFPDSWIFFGILHHMALGGVLVLALRPLPAPLIATIGVTILVAGDTLSFAALDDPALRWLGLGVTVPESNDFVPLFPWFGWMGLGLAVGRWWRAAKRPWGAHWSPNLTLARTLTWAGRWSLVIYLAHQPMLYGAVWLYADLIADVPAYERLGTGERGAFIGSCASSCVAAGGTAAGGTAGPTCQTMCVCIADGAEREGLWRGLLNGGLSADDTGRLNQVIGACRVN